MVRSRDGEDLVESVTREPVTRDPMWREPDLSRLALQGYVSRTEWPVVGSYVCRDHRSIQHTLYVHLDVLPVVKI